MIFSVSERPKYIVALFTGGKTTVMGFVYRNKSNTIKITGLIGILKKNEFDYCKNYEKSAEKAFTASSAAI